MYATAFLLQAMVASVAVVAQNSITPGVFTDSTAVVAGFNSTVPVNPGVPVTSFPGFYPNSSTPNPSGSVSYTTSVAIIAGVTTSVVIEVGATSSSGSAPFPTDSGLPQSDGVAVGATLGMAVLSVISILVLAL